MPSELLGIHIWTSPKALTHLWTAQVRASSKMKGLSTDFSWCLTKQRQHVDFSYNQCCLGKYNKTHEVLHCSVYSKKLSDMKINGKTWPSINRKSNKQKPITKSSRSGISRQKLQQRYRLRRTCQGKPCATCLNSDVLMLMAGVRFRVKNWCRIWETHLVAGV